MIKQLDRDSLLKKLSGGEGRRANIYNFILNNRFISAYGLNDSLLFIGESDRVWCWIDSNSEADITQLMNKAEEIKNFGWLGGLPEEILLDRNDTEWILRTDQYILDNTILLPDVDLESKSLKKEDAEYIYQNSTYKDFTDTDYISTRIENGETACIRQDGRLVAWGLTHDDGAMGFLHVMPEFRGKGFAKVVTIDLIKKLRIADKPVYVQIEKSNEASLGLAKRLGFKLHCTLSWFAFRDSP